MQNNKEKNIIEKFGSPESGDSFLRFMFSVGLIYFTLTGIFVYKYGLIGVIYPFILLMLFVSVITG